MKLLKILLIITLTIQALAAESELKHPGMLKDYSAKINKLDFGEHMLISILMGTFSGAVFGAGSGMIFYDSNDENETKNKLIISGASLALVGAIAGGVVSVFEYNKKTQFNYGKPLLNYTWYGGLGGGIVGALGGLIPYSSSEDIDDILHFTGYGVIGGLIVGWVAYGIIQPNDDIRTSFDYDHKRENYVLSFTKLF